MFAQHVEVLVQELLALGMNRLFTKKPSPYRADCSAISGLRMEPCQTNGGVPFSGRGVAVKWRSGVLYLPPQVTSSSRQRRCSKAQPVPWPAHRRAVGRPYLCWLA